MVALLASVVFLAFLVEASLGFGATLLAVALGALVCPLDVLLPTLVLLNLPLSAWIVWRDRRAIDRRLLIRLVVGMGIGLPVGLAVFLWSAPQAVLVLLGLLVAGFALVELLRRPDSERAPLPARARDLLLFLGGVAHGLYATGGPLAVYVSGRQLDDKQAFRGTLAFLWLLLNAALLVGYAVAGKVGRDPLELTLFLFPALVLGALVGDWLHRRVASESFRRLVFGLLFVTGVTLVVSPA